MSEISDTATLVKLGGEGTYYLIKGSVKGVMYLYQALKRMNAAKILGNGEVQDFEKFLKATEGRYEMINIPTENPEVIAKMKEDLDKMHVGYHVLPDLNVGDGQIQLAYAIDDKAKVEAWYKSFCLDRLQAGGEKTYQDLMNLTGGQVSIVNIPWPDTDTVIPTEEMPAEMEKLQGALKQSGIPNGVMPDLNKNDGRIQLMTPSYNAREMQDWYTKYTQLMQNHMGRVTQEEMPIESIDEYLQSGISDAYTYVGSANEEIKQILRPQTRGTVKKTAGKEVPVSDPLEVKQPEKTLNELIELTGGKVSVARLPLPELIQDKAVAGKPEVKESSRPRAQSLTREENLQRLKADLDKLHINYTILPDLNVGDGYVQIAYATADAPKVKAWYEAYQNDMLTAGVPLEEMQEISLSDYMETGKVEEPEQVRTNERERRSKSEIKEPRKKKGQTVYEKIKSSTDIREISINGNLVKNMDARSSQGFQSRIPGTQEYFNIKPDLLYQMDDGKTFGILAAKETEIDITDADGRYLRTAKFEEIQPHYDTMRDGVEKAEKKILYQKTEDPQPHLKKTVPSQEEIPHKKPDKKNKFNNFEQRDYPKEFYNDMERLFAQGGTAKKAENIEFEHLLDRMETQTTRYVDVPSDNGVFISQNIQCIERDNGDVAYVAQIGDTEEYYTGIADEVVREKDTIRPVVVNREREVTIINKDGDFLRSAKLKDIIENTIPETQKPVANAIKQAVKTVTGPKL